MPNNNQFLNGSEWRKWDLHVHAPGSKQQELYVTEDGSNPLDVFCDIIEQSDTDVFGITDYFSVENYFIFLEWFKTKFPDSKKAFFPNIEFRLDDKNKESDYVNFHVIFSDEVAQDDIQKFLCDIELKNLHPDGGGSTLKCNPIDLGMIGYDKALVTIDAILESHKKTFGKRDISFMCGVANGYGGIRPPQQQGRHTEYAKIVDDVCQIFFGRAQDKDFFLGTTRYEGSISKPVICGCDAHSFDQLNAWLGKQVISNNEKGESYIEKDVTWIKADQTFEGLRQILYEPSDRVKIQEHSPYADNSKIYFKSLDLSGSVNFILPDIELPINRELVAIIGGRGSGKSALLDTFAFLNEEHLKKDQNGKKKIIEYYRDNEGYVEPRPSFMLTTTLVDKDGVEQDFEKTLIDRDDIELPFLYLGQEQLSGIATNDSELTRTVCQLIGIDINEIGTESLIARARTTLSDINNTRKSLSDIYERCALVGYVLGTDITVWLREYCNKLKEQQKRLSSRETRDVLEDISTKTKRGLRLKDLNEKVAVLLSTLKDIPLNVEISAFNLQLREIYTDCPELAPLSSSSQIAAVIALQNRITAEMDKLRTEIATKKIELIKQDIKEDVNSLLQASESLEREIGVVEKDQKNCADAVLRLENLHIQRGKILEDIQTSLKSLGESISSAFNSFQGSRSDSITIEKELFEKMIKGISIEGAIEFNQRVFANKVLTEFVDRRTVPNEITLRELIAGKNTDGTIKEITLENLFLWAQSDLGSQKCFSRGGLDNLVEYIFTEWPDFLKVRAVAKLNGKSTEVLSIGQRGTLLLKVYLATASAKQVFVIDQPEDNLDNNFIMNELVPLIRNAKRSRQIIMSTHNANLVVNADAEQVIIAQLDHHPAGSYLTGSIEAPEINKNIRDILEGGEEAFRQRERKYFFKS